MRCAKQDTKPKTGNFSAGQVSTELLLILAVVFVFIAALMLITMTQSASLNQATEEAKVDNALSDLSGAAKEVYAQGLGAKKQVYVNIPDGIDPTKTYVANKSIRFSFNGNDHVANEEFDVRGTLPTSEGGHIIWVISEGNKVRIGYAMVELSKQTLLVTMKPNETIATHFTVTNVWSRPINISLGDKWNHERVSFSLDRYSDELDVGESGGFNAVFSSNEKAIGIYTSEITILASDDRGNVEYVRLPMILQVMPELGTRPPLIVKPNILNATVNRTGSVARTFQVCTNEVTKVDAVNFEPSPDAPGEWVSGNSPLPALDYDSCMEKLLTVTVPYDAFGDNHTGYVNVIGVGVPEARDSIAELIEVAGGGDNEGPEVYNITTGVRRVHEGEPTTFFAIGDDTLHGNSSISRCLISVDNESAQPMFPSDGRFNSPVEHVFFINTTGYGTGTHVALLNCTDNPGNTGPTEMFNFTIGKHILFVVAAGNESNWSDWIDSFKYRGNYDWSHDIANFDEVLSGEVNLWYYDTVIFLDWMNNDDFVDEVVGYHDEGGFIGLFGGSAHLAVRDLGVEWHPDNPHVESEVNILNASHYVTEGLLPDPGTGMLQIADEKTKFYLLWYGNETNQLGGSGWFFPDTKRLMLAEVNRTLFWGVGDPFRLNDDGVEITARVIDWMINQSLVE